MDDARLRAARLGADWFCAMLASTPVEMPGEGVLVGPPHFNWQAADEKCGPSPCWDNLHAPLNAGQLLRLGFAGIAAQARANAARLTGEPALYLEAVARCHQSAADTAARYADAADFLQLKANGDPSRRVHRIATTCRALAQGPPRTFLQAVQLFWFAFAMRNRSFCSPIGRLDQHLYPFYRDEVAAGDLTRDAALDLLCELWECLNRTGSGDLLMNLAVGGCDAYGRDQTNDVSVLMLEASCRVHRTEPTVNVRLHHGSPEAFLDKVAELQLLGGGKGTLLNDDVLIPALVAHGVDADLAATYCCDGCNEIVFDGETVITFGLVEAVKSLELTLFNGRQNVPPAEARANYWRASDQPPQVKTGLTLGHESGDFAAMTSFDQVYDAFLDQYLHQARLHLDRIIAQVHDCRAHAVAEPFLAGTFPACLATGNDPWRGGCQRPVFMLFSGGIPTAADGLAAIRRVVFEDRCCTPAQLLEALRADFVGHEELRQRCLAAPKFGNDDAAADELAGDLARRFCRFVLDYPCAHPEGLWPALFSNVFNMFSRMVAATPDGRRWGDPICAHYSPTPGRACKGPTAVLHSLASAPTNLAIGCAVSNLTLSRANFPPGDRGRQLLRQLTDTGLALGLSVLSVAVQDVEALRDAQVHPERHPDLMVRVWGFSARFVELDGRMQEHVIARTTAQ